MMSSTDLNNYEQKINKKLSDYERAVLIEEAGGRNRMSGGVGSQGRGGRPRSRIAASLDDFIDDIGRRGRGPRASGAYDMNSPLQSSDYDPRRVNQMGVGSKPNLRRGASPAPPPPNTRAIGSDMYNQNSGSYNPNSCASSVSSFMTNEPLDDLNSPRQSQRQSQGQFAGSQRQIGGSREILPLPIDIPDNVSNAEAFRRYLNARRNAIDYGVDRPLDYGASVPDRRGRLNSADAKKQFKQATSANRRTIALSHALMTLALLSASASQLRFVIAYSSAHAFPALNYFLVCTCIAIEVFVGIGYIILGRFDFSDRVSDIIHSCLIFGLFVVAISNVIVAAFAIDDHVCEVIARQTELNYQELISQKNGPN